MRVLWEATIPIILNGVFQLFYKKNDQKDLAMWNKSCSICDRLRKWEVCGEGEILVIVKPQKVGLRAKIFGFIRTGRWAKKPKIYMRKFKVFLATKLKIDVLRPFTRWKIRQR